MSDKLKIAIVGWHEGAAGLVHSWIEQSNNCTVECFINPEDSEVIIENPPVRAASQFSYPKPDSFKGIPLINAKNWPQAIKDMGIQHALVTLTDAEQRVAQCKFAKQSGITLINAIHPSVLILEDAILGENIILHARAVVGYRAEIFDAVIVNTGAQLDHHCVVREGATIAPGIVTAGHVTIGELATVFSGAVIRDNLTIGKHSVVGAGAVVVSDVPDGVCVVGVPAKPMRKQRAGTE